MINMSKIKISQYKLEKLCWAFHKGARIYDYTKNSHLMEAISEMDDYCYPALMTAALEEIGVEVKMNKNHLHYYELANTKPCVICGKRTRQKDGVCWGECKKIFKKRGITNGR